MTALTINSRLAWIVKPLVSLIAVCAVCAACSSQDDTAKIRALIDQGAALVEAHDIPGMLKLASGDIRAMPMDLDQRGIQAVLWRTFKVYGPLKILYPRPVVEINEAAENASAQVPFLIVKKDHPFQDLEILRDSPMAWVEAIGQTADLYRLQLQWVKRDGTWLVDRALLERFTGLRVDDTHR